MSGVQARPGVIVAASARRDSGWMVEARAKSLSPWRSSTRAGSPAPAVCLSFRTSSISGSRTCVLVMAVRRVEASRSLLDALVEGRAVGGLRGLPGTSFPNASASWSWLGRASWATTWPSRRKTRLGHIRTWKERPRGRPGPSSTLKCRTSGWTVEVLRHSRRERAAVAAPRRPELQEDGAARAVDLLAGRGLGLVAVVGLGGHGRFLESRTSLRRAARGAASG